MTVRRDMDDLIIVKLGTIFEDGTVIVSFDVVPQGVLSVEVTTDVGESESLWKYDCVQVGRICFDLGGGGGEYAAPTGQFGSGFDYDGKY